MKYERLPWQVSSGAWPAGPFDVGTDTFEQSHARLVAQLAATLVERRKHLQLSRAALARRAGVAAHTVGRIESGQTWPDLGVFARLAHVLGMELGLVGSGWVEAGPATTAPAAPPTPVKESAPPLELGLGRSDSVTSAHVIEAVLHHSPSVRREVERLSRARQPAPRMTRHTGTRL